MSTVLDPPAEVELPDRCELIDGQVVEVPPMSAYAAEVAALIHERLVAHTLATPCGRARLEMLFNVPFPLDPDRKRIPDVAYISFDRWAEDRPLPYRGKPMDVIPDLCVEVVSPTDTVDELTGKVDEYLQAGVRLVWVVHPRLRRIDAYTARGTPPRVFTDADTLDAGDVLPGFAAPMAALFPPLDPAG